MDIVWDEIKRQQNLIKHGLDFTAVQRFDWVTAIVHPARFDRMLALGYIDAQLVSVVFAMRGTQGISIISLRPASQKERRLYGTR
jgi:uncharacterized DUF497 family protein